MKALETTRADSTPANGRFRHGHGRQNELLVPAPALQEVLLAKRAGDHGALAMASARLALARYSGADDYWLLPWRRLDSQSRAPVPRRVRDLVGGFIKLIAWTAQDPEEWLVLSPPRLPKRLRDSVIHLHRPTPGDVIGAVDRYTAALRTLEYVPRGFTEVSVAQYFGSQPVTATALRSNSIA